MAHEIWAEASGTEIVHGIEGAALVIARYLSLPQVVPGGLDKEARQHIQWHIDDSKSRGEPTDKANWGYEHGVLLTLDEAQVLLDASTSQEEHPRTWKIVREYLIDNGFDGLFDDECGCTVTDLMPCCGEAFYGCSPGYKIPCDPEFCSHGCDFHIGPKKQGEKG